MSDDANTPAQPGKGYAHRKGLLLAVLVAGSTLFGATVGYAVGKNSAAAKHVDQISAATNGVDAEDVASRNLVWKSLNKDGDAIPDDVPEKYIGKIVELVLSPDAAPQDRANGVQLLMQKSGAYFTDDQRDKLVEAFIGPDPQQHVLALHRVVNADLQGARLLLQVLSDHYRIQAYLEGKKIELEKLPDGTVP